MLTMLLVFTVCFKDNCHEYVIESYTEPKAIALQLCKADGTLFDEQNDNSMSWHCSTPTDYTPSYIPKLSRD